MEAVRRITNEIRHSPARLALAWAVGRPAVASTPMDVSRPARVEDNIAALDIVLSAEHLAVLDAATELGEPRLVYGLLRLPVRDQIIFGGHTVLGPATR